MSLSAALASDPPASPAPPPVASAASDEPPDHGGEVCFAAERRGQLVFAMMASSGSAIGAEIDLRTARLWRALLDAAIGSGEARTARQDRREPEVFIHEVDRSDPNSVARAGIRAWRALHRDEDLDEVVECPACGGSLHLRMHSQNSHVHGRCETDGCARWIE